MGSCSTCKFWRKWADDKNGRCRRYPPQVIYSLDNPDGCRTVWPETKPHDVCGEYSK